MRFFDQSNISEPDYGTGDDAHDFAEAVVYAYSTDELSERIPEWFGKNNLCTVYDQWWTDVNEFMSDAEMDEVWDYIVADGSVYRLVLAYLIARKGYVWESFLGYYADKEESSYESFH